MADNNTRLMAVLSDVVQRRSAGERVDDAAVIAEHGDLMPELAGSLRALRTVDQAEREARRRGGAVGGAADPHANSQVDGTSLPIDGIPGYAVAERLDRGGQGVVYRAVQRTTGQAVAIKVIREGPFAGAQGQARFDREVRILAQLRHPNIVHIHDSGVARGQHYFVMDYIAGRTLDEQIAGAADEIGPVLGLFLKVCRAVNAAHLRGVIHRDLKPSNIIVDDDGEPHVLDFGLAKLDEASSDDDPGAQGMTVTGQFIGSAPWSSPEQVEGPPDRVDLRTDVYSLGMILFRMLTGRMPYPDETNVRRVFEHIVHTEPVRPSTLRPDVDGELDTIVLKCLAKEPQRRYQSAVALAEDIERYMSGQPLLARMPSTMYQLRKLVQRHKLSAALVAALAVTAALSAVSLGILYRRAALRKSEAESARAQAEAVTDFLTHTLASAAPEKVPGQDLTVRALVDRAAEESGVKFASEPLVEAAVRYTLGYTYASLGDFEAAEAHHRRAYTIRLELLGAEHRATLIAADALAGVLLYRGASEEAEQLETNALRIRERLLGTGSPEAIPSYRNLARIYQRQGRYDEAESFFLRALMLQRQTIGEEHLDTIETTANLAQSYAERGRNEQALPLYERALEARQRALGDEHPRTLATMSDLAIVYKDLGQLDRAEPLYERTLDAQRRILGEEHPDTLSSKNNLALLYLTRGRPTDARPIYEQTLLSMRKVHGENHPDTLIAMNNLARTLSELGDHEQAARLFEEMLALAANALPPGHLLVPVARGYYGQCLTQLERYDEAEQQLGSSVQALEQSLGPDNPRTVKVRELIKELEERRAARDGQSGPVEP